MALWLQRAVRAAAQPGPLRALATMHLAPVPMMPTLLRRGLHVAPALHHYNDKHVARLRAKAEASGKSLPIEADPSQTVYYSRRNIDGSPWKLNLLARQIRGLRIDDAIVQMDFSTKKVASHIAQVLRIAKQNAKVHNKIEDNSNLYIHESYVGKGDYGRGIRRANRGRFYRATKRKAHYFVKLRHGSPPKPDKPKNRYHMVTQQVLEQLEKNPPRIRNSLEQEAARLKY